MVDTEWFRIYKDRAALGINGKKGFQRTDFPYFIDRETFDSLESCAAFYEYSGRKDFDDFIFEPTFMLSERYEELFKLLEPDLEFESINLIDEKKKEKAPAPVYMLPFLPCTEAVHNNSKIVQGKAESLVLIREALAGKRIVHCHLPADDIWLFSLEAAECILRRGPIGIGFKKVVEYV